MNPFRRRIQTAMQQGGGAAAFSPASIPGLQLWLDASQIVGLNDGDVVTTWQDLSGNGNDVTQTTGSRQPTYQTNEVNGKPCVRFDGVDDFLRCTTFSQAQPLTVLVVSKLTGSTGQKRMFDGNTSRFLIGLQLGANLIFYAGGEINYADAPPWPWRYYTGIFHGSSSSQYRNGTLLGNGNPGTWSLDDLMVGAGVFGFEPWEGDIAELIIYDSSLSAGNLALLHSYIASKYGL